MTKADTINLKDLTVDVVSAHVSNNNVATSDLPNLIKSVYDALSWLGKEAAAAPEEKQAPAVSVRSSIKPDYLVCLEDGKKLTMLKRYLSTRFNLTPDQYRTKWNLPKDYPMVAPNYADKRRSLAHAIGLGRKTVEAVEEVAVAATVPVRRRVRKTTEEIKDILSSTPEPAKPRGRKAAAGRETGSSVQEAPKAPRRKLKVKTD